jgi:hypothetical protein
VGGHQGHAAEGELMTRRRSLMPSRCPPTPPRCNLRHCTSLGRQTLPVLPNHAAAIASTTHSPPPLYAVVHQCLVVILFSP